MFYSAIIAFNQLKNVGSEEVKIRSIITSFVFCGLSLSRVDPSAAETFVQSTSEIRTYLYLRISEDKINQLLPKGWVTNPGTNAIEGANIGIIFIEGLSGSDASNKPFLFRESYAVVGVLAKNIETGVSTFMIINGLVPESQNPPGAYKAYSSATIAMEKQIKSSADKTIVSEVWHISTGNGDKVDFETSFERGVGVRTHAEPKVYSGITPDFYRIYKADFVSDAVHSAQITGKRAISLNFSASGPLFQNIFDGQEKVVAVISIPQYYRQIFLPN